MTRAQDEFVWFGVDLAKRPDVGIAIHFPSRRLGKSVALAEVMDRLARDGLPLVDLRTDPLGDAR